MAQPLTPEQLLAQAAQNDMGAMAELYDQCAPGLLGMLARILPGRDAAEEVLEEIFVRLWEQARSLVQSGGSVAAWLVVTARASALARRRIQPVTPRGPVIPLRSGKGRAPRSRAASPRPSTQNGVGPFLAASLAWLPPPEEIARMDDRRELLRKFLRQLPKAQEAALDLVVFEGCTDVEIAERLGEPLGKVKSSLQAAMTFLHHRLRAVLGTWTANV